MKKKQRGYKYVQIHGIEVVYFPVYLLTPFICRGRVQKCVYF